MRWYLLVIVIYNIFLTWEWESHTCGVHLYVSRGCMQYITQDTKSYKRGGKLCNGYMQHLSHMRISSAFVRCTPMWVDIAYNLLHKSFKRFGILCNG